MSYPWEKTEITDRAGNRIEASAPLIISASRATDIPAFYGSWFVNRLRDGYVKWQNPFSGKMSAVSFERTRFFVFWSKNPRPFLPVLDSLAEKGIGFYLLYTVNNYDRTGLEPNVPPLEERTGTFIEISRRFGKERILWRFDPFFLTDTIGIRELVPRIREAGDAIHPYTGKLIFSFCEISRYPKVVRSLNRENIKYIEYTPELMNETVSELEKLNRNWGLELASCAQETDLSRFGVTHNKCIDDNRIALISPGDRELMTFLGRDPLFPSIAPVKEMKDKGQRKFCRCIPSKDIGQYDTCPHFCVYCYANTSRKTVNANLSGIHDHSESITG